MAQAARIFKGNLDYPEFSTQALVAAEKAYNWAKNIHMPIMTKTK